MKTKIILLTALISAGLLAGTSAFAAGPRGGNGSGNRNSSAPAAPVRDGSGKAINQRGNPNSTGTPMRDGSGKATAPGKGAKDGTGNPANCPVPPQS